MKFTFMYVCICEFEKSLQCDKVLTNTFFLFLALSLSLSLPLYNLYMYPFMFVNAWPILFIALHALFIIIFRRSCLVLNN